MTRSTKNNSLAFVALTLVLASTSGALACGGGGGFRGGFGGGYAAPRPTYHRPVYRQPVLHRPVVARPVITQPAPTFQQPIQQPTLPQPAAVAGPQPIAQPAPVQQPTASAEQSALEALQALMGGAPAAQPAAGHVGAWTATVGGNNQVSLQLDATGAFRWTANSGGKVSTFEGRYTMAGGQLTLIRGDNQQLAGSWAADTTGGFRFTLAGQQSGLLFVRG